MKNLKNKTQKKKKQPRVHFFRQFLCVDLNAVYKTQQHPE